MKRPWFKFFPDDWYSDLGLRRCSGTARGLWIDMMCLMHQGTPYGHLKVAPGELARLTGMPLKQVRRCLKELERWSVFSRLEDGTVLSRRMIRDEMVREKRAAGGYKSVEHPNTYKPEGYPLRVPGRVYSQTTLPPDSVSMGLEVSTENQKLLLQQGSVQASVAAATTNRNGFDFETWFERIYARHPRKGKKQIQAQYASEHVPARVSPEDAERMHALYCESDEWKRGFAPALGDFFSSETYRYPPSKPTQEETELERMNRLKL